MTGGLDPVCGSGFLFPGSICDQENSWIQIWIWFVRRSWIRSISYRIRNPASTIYLFYRAILAKSFQVYCKHGFTVFYSYCMPWAGKSRLGCLWYIMRVWHIVSNVETESQINFFFDSRYLCFHLRQFIYIHIYI